jgi:hypothetical protein
MRASQLIELEARRRLDPRVITNQFHDFPRPEHQDEPGASIMARDCFHLAVRFQSFWQSFQHIDYADILIICAEYTDFPVGAAGQNKQIITGDCQNRTIVFWWIAQRNTAIVSPDLQLARFCAHQNIDFVDIAANQIFVIFCECDAARGPPG